MRKVLPYIIVLTTMVFFGLLLLGGYKNTRHMWDERITLRERDKIPYGTAAARSLLPALFPKASFSDDSKSPGNWDSITASSYNQAVILMAGRFDADNEELNRLLTFAQEGNYVFIIARTFSREAIDFFRFYYNENEFDNELNFSTDSLMIKLESPFEHPNHLYLYPGKKFESKFYSLDTTHTIVLGRSRDGNPDFVQYKIGNGSIFVHSAPLAFSNYFLLHKNNIQYFQNALSVIPATVEKVVWNEYYLIKPGRKNVANEPGWFKVLLRYPAFKWGLLTGIITVFLFLLLGMRRRQRMIPPYEKPKNESLDFIKTLGRLYYDQKDHHNLAKKMAVYFLEHVRSTYKINTQVLDDSFILSLQEKSGYPRQELTSLISFIKGLEEDQAVSEVQLTDFYKQLDLFYQNT
jgi:hypothetical protein